MIQNKRRFQNETGNVGGLKNIIGAFFLTLVITKYLKKGAGLGWCEYDAKKERGDKRVAMYDLDGNFIMEEYSTCELARRVFKETGIKLYDSNISKVCNGKQKHHKGYTFKYIED